VKNTLATVQSIAVQTLNRSDDMEAFRDTFVSRLMALSGTHNLLVRHEWTGTSFCELVDNTLAHYGRPYGCDGEDLVLDANGAVTLGMALHELATNALKHGAWAGAGRVDVSVRPEEDGAHVVIEWRESGGRKVVPPRVRGFGSRLLERGVAGELGGQVTLEFEPSGLVCLTVRQCRAACGLRPDRDQAIAASMNAGPVCAMAAANAWSKASAVSQRTADSPRPLATDTQSILGSPRSSSLAADGPALPAPVRVISTFRMR
jgi:two-component sensor histidine kinase